MSAAAHGRRPDLRTPLRRRAEASPCRWAQPGGPADRRVLELCELVLAAVCCDIELDIGRDTARVALHRLADDGWITRTQPARGIHAAHLGP